MWINALRKENLLWNIPFAYFSGLSSQVTKSIENVTISMNKPKIVFVKLY